MTNRKWPAKISAEELHRLIAATLQETQQALGLKDPIDARHRHLMCSYAATQLTGGLVGDVLYYRGEAAIADQSRIAESVLVCFSALQVREALRCAIYLHVDNLQGDTANDEHE